MKTKPRGIWAMFQTECVYCHGDLTITNGRQDPHDCREPDDGIARLKAAFDAAFDTQT